MEQFNDKDLENIHTIPIKNVYSLLNSSEKGVSDAKKRLDEFGLNKLSEKKEKLLIVKFLLQFNNFFSYLLLFGAGLSFFSEYVLPGEGSIYIAYALLGVTILNAAFTFIQEYKAEQAMKSFNKLMTAQAVVLRDGKSIQIDSTSIVPGDILLLSEGDKISADARIIEESQFKVDHSTLTGESEPQLRSVEATSKKAILSRNMVFSGTLVQAGSGKAVVVSTGDNTQIGKIAKVTSEVGVGVSHLQKQIGHFIKIISYIAIFLGISFFGMGLFITKNPFWTNMVFAIGIIVANVPEGLLPTVTLTLSIAAQKMAKKNVLIKNIDAIETLGSLTVICSDKTGTLTENNLFVHGFYMNNRFYSFDRDSKNVYLGKKTVNLSSVKGSKDFLDVLLLCNNSTLSDKGNFGDSTEVCLKEFVSDFHNIEYIEKMHKRTKEVPFSSETKFMITTNKFDSKNRSFLKGAIKVVLSKCDRIFVDGKKVKLNKKIIDTIVQKNRDFAARGFRVLGAALKENDKALDKGFCFYGLIVMQDPPRKEVPAAVEECHAAGIKIIVISGDQATTVESITKQVGICKDPFVVKADEMHNYSDDKLKEILSKDCVVFARALPKDKLRIVSLLQELNEVVAVTGDGVNDAPALRKADVGVSMGKCGTEVAKEASDVVLLDDNFASIVNAIKSGRTVYDNIKSFITYILTSNTPEIIPFLLFILLGWPLALPVMLILAIDLGTDVLPAIGLGVEKPPKDIMQRKPRSPKSKLLNWKMIARSYGFIGPLQTAFAYIVFFSILIRGGWSFGVDIGVRDPLYMSAIMGFLATVVVVQMFNVFACRTTRSSVFTEGLFSNKLIFVGIASEIILLILIATLLSPMFGTSTFPFFYVYWMIGFGVIVLVLEELRKLVYRRTGHLGIDEVF